MIISTNCDALSSFRRIFPSRKITRLRIRISWRSCCAKYTLVSLLISFRKIISALSVDHVTRFSACCIDSAFFYGAFGIFRDFLCSEANRCVLMFFSVRICGCFLLYLFTFESIVCMNGILNDRVLFLVELLYFFVIVVFFYVNQLHGFFSWFCYESNKYFKN